MKLQDFVQDKPILETGQLILRPLRKEDVADLKEWLGRQLRLSVLGQTSRKK